MKYPKLNQIGDTIIEAMIATAVMGAVIAGAYTIANRSLRAARQAQEHGEALKIAEGQTELLKNYTSSVPTPSGTSIFSNSPTPVFCMDPANGKRIDKPSVATIPSLSADDWANYANCTNGLYHYAIEVSTLSSGASVTRYQFKVVVRWDGIGGAARDEEVIQYRLIK